MRIKLGNAGVLVHINDSDMGVMIIAIHTKSRPTKFGVPALTEKHPSAITNNFKVAQISGLPSDKVRVVITVTSTAVVTKTPFLSNPLPSVHRS